MTKFPKSQFDFLFDLMSKDGRWFAFDFRSPKVEVVVQRTVDLTKFSFIKFGDVTRRTRPLI